MMRTDRRAANELRKVTIIPHFMPHAEGSCLITMGNTRVICSATIEKTVPSWMKGKGVGWLTAEYAMLPRATNERVQRERTKVSGRTAEIQRIIGRSLRAVFDHTKIGERTIILDADVLQADGGTRTASITGCYVALALAVEKLRKDRDIDANPLLSGCAAVSVGIIDGKPMLDLTYAEDSAAHVDMNVVMTDDGRYIEIQGTAEHNPFSKDERDALLTLAESGIMSLIALQKKVIADT